MAIILSSISGITPLASYAQLVASVSTWAHRTDLEAIYPNFVALAEARISRDMRLRKQIVTTTLSALTGVQSVSLPSDWLELENVSVNTVPVNNLIYVTVEQLGNRFPVGGVNGVPVNYTIEGDNLLLGPAPSSNMTISLIYYAKFPSLLDSGSNWLMTTHPSIYLFAVLMEVMQYTQNPEQLAIYMQRYEKESLQLQNQDDRAVRSGSALRVRTI